MLKTVHRRKTKRLLINSMSFLLPLSAGKLVKIQMMHPGLLLGEQLSVFEISPGGKGKGNLVERETCKLTYVCKARGCASGCYYQSERLF